MSEYFLITFLNYLIFVLTDNIVCNYLKGWICGQMYVLLNGYTNKWKCQFMG